MTDSYCPQHVHVVPYKVAFIFLPQSNIIYKLEDLKVLRRSPDLFYNVRIGKGQQPLILIKHILFYHIILWGLQLFWSSDLKQSNEYSINSPVISEKPMLS